jgi:hypothetical protein
VGVISKAVCCVFFFPVSGSVSVTVPRFFQRGTVTETDKETSTPPSRSLVSRAHALSLFLSTPILMHAQTEPHTNTQKRRHNDFFLIFFYTNMYTYTQNGWHTEVPEREEFSYRQVLCIQPKHCAS